MGIRCYIDFDSDGDFSDFAEDITIYLISAQWSLGISDIENHVGDETRLTMVLKNGDRRFSPEYSGGPYYGNLAPWRQVLITYEHEGTETTLYRGYTEAIQPQTTGGTTATIVCAGAKTYMQDQIIDMELLQNVTSGEVIEAILTRLHVPPLLSEAWLLGIPGMSELGESTYFADLSVAADIDTGQSTFEYVGDNWSAKFAGNQYVSRGKDHQSSFKGYDAIADVVLAEQGYFYFGRDGKAYFKDRTWLQMNYSAVASYTSADFLANGVSYTYGEPIYNEVIVYSYPRALTANAVLFTLVDPVTIRPESDKKITARYSERDSEQTVGAINAYVDTLTATGDYTIVSEFKAQSADFTITNTGTSDVVVSELIVKGDKLTSYDKVESTASDATSISLYGRRSKRVDSKLQTDTNFAESLAGHMLNQYKDARGRIDRARFKVHGDRVAMLTERGIGDRISLSDTQTAHSGEYFIMGEEFAYTLRGGLEVSWYLRPADMTKYWLLGVAGFGELGETSVLGL